MKKLDFKIVCDYIESNIGIFHQKRIESVAKLKLKEVLQRKNPYLFRAKNLLTAQDLVKAFWMRFFNHKRKQCLEIS